MPVNGRGLEPKQARFVEEYLKDLNASAAAVRTGYSKKGADVAGARLLANVGIASEIARITAERTEKAGVDAVKVLKEVQRLAFSDIRGLFDKKGNLKPLHTLTDDEAASIAGCEIIVKNATAGDGHTDTIHKIKVWDKPRNLEMLMKHLGLLIERVQANVNQTIGWLG